MFRWNVTVLKAPKAGNSELEYEDAYRISPAKKTIGKKLRVAIADGATMTSFSALWAKELTKCFAANTFLTYRGLRNCTYRSARVWREQVFSPSLPLPWYAEEKARKGAFSTFLGLQLSFATVKKGNSQEQNYQWNALAIGDSNIFQIREGKLYKTFPIEHVEEFGSTPALLSSNIKRNQDIWEEVKSISGEWRSGDLFILATDALAAWFLKKANENDEPWRELDSFSGDNEHKFHEWLLIKRESREIRNDDVTCIILQVQAEE